MEAASQKKKRGKMELWRWGLTKADSGISSAGISAPDARSAGVEVLSTEGTAADPCSGMASKDSSRSSSRSKSKVKADMRPARLLEMRLWSKAEIWCASHAICSSNGVLTLKAQTVILAEGANSAVIISHSSSWVTVLAAPHCRPQDILRIIKII